MDIEHVRESECYPSQGEKYAGATLNARRCVRARQSVGAVVLGEGRLGARG